MNNTSTPRLYVIVREDLAYKYIQGGHALAQFALEHNAEFRKWNNGYLIYLSTFNGLTIREKATEFEKKGLSFSKFVEPDLESELPTALAIFEDGTGFVSKFVKDLSLATK
jgi:hypothetical protein